LGNELRVFWKYDRFFGEPINVRQKYQILRKIRKRRAFLPKNRIGKKMAQKGPFSIFSPYQAHVFFYAKSRAKIFQLLC
jgi:hypothetical protein